MPAHKRSAQEAELDEVDLTELPSRLDVISARRIVDTAQVGEFEEISVENIKQFLIDLGKCIVDNQQLRIGHPDDPRQFLESEATLDENLRRLRAVAADSSVASEFVGLGGLDVLCGLLSHPNTDIAIDGVDVLTELTEPDLLKTYEDEGQVALQQVVDLELPMMAVETVLRLNEELEDDYAAISQTMQLIENLIDFSPTLMGEEFSRVPKFVSWLLKRVRAGDKVDFNRVYAAELLGILLQTSLYCREHLGRRDGVDGVDKLLKVIAVYRKKNPDNVDETELVANLFDCLCSLMLVPAHRQTFAEIQGVELLVRFLRERNESYRAALRLLSFCLVDTELAANRFVASLGLQPLFSLLLRKGVKTKRHSPQAQEDDEYITSAVLSLMRHATGEFSARVLAKFLENKGSKLRRLLDMRDAYNLRLSQHTADIDVGDDSDDGQHYLELCEHGLAVLQQIDLIVVRLALSGNALLAKSVTALMRLKGVDTVDVTQNLEKMASQIGSEDERVMTLELAAQFIELLHPVDS